MINTLHALTHRPERGWDPIPSAHVRLYGDEEWQKFSPELVDELEGRLGGLAGRRVLDLGGGPGHYSVALARRGAEVTWHDVSRGYRDFARSRARQAGVDIDFSLGYLEDARMFVRRPFDLVFCRICWRYCRNDRSFARLVYSLVAPGGAGYIDSGVDQGRHPTRWMRWQAALNARLGWKIGHPDPPGGRLPRLFRRLPLAVLEVDSSIPGKERIWFVKPQISTEH